MGKPSFLNTAELMSTCLPFTRAEKDVTCFEGYGLHSVP